MQRFIAEQNIAHFRTLLATQQSEQEKQRIQRLLTDEEAKLRAIEKEERQARLSR
jgi:hypothetical protein